MVGPNFMDEIDCGSFFDHIDDLLDFPVEEVEGGAPTLPSVAAAAAAGNCNSLASIWPAGADSFPGSDSVFSGNSASDLSAELSVPYEDILQLEWLSNFVEDSFCGGSLTMKKVEEPSCTTKEDSVHNQFHTSSPVSVLESSSSCSVGKTVPAPPRSPEVYIPVPCGRARSKRPRPATFNPRPAMNLISPASSFVGENIQPNVISSKTSSDSENFAESQLVAKIPKQGCGEAKKKKKVKVTVPAAGGDSNQNGLQAVRKCMHCEITKTPQWRAGPMGPKTLCNACGVRFKSGRLYPEYRPAASPTFCPSLHSNSHKKVLEMRCRGIEKSGFAMNNNAAASPELIPNTNSSLSLEYI
ncbi:GATA transcription factor 8 [Vigna radiata var. radiata]|uniref:GATA transcription factor n=1 Tax=Vigna radiata var. radiata TaxID=3916 RepID=A0A1S3V8A5_VIGRR|nr:GATA transcription factor 8 [Vigna radiata var. radiata]XP_022641165.1 GATA transcription factor 8 [Vigna radiata var. radiata]